MVYRNFHYYFNTTRNSAHGEVTFIVWEICADASSTVGFYCSVYSQWKSFRVLSSAGWAVHTSWPKCCLCIIVSKFLSVWMLTSMAQIVTAAPCRDL